MGKKALVFLAAAAMLTVPGCKSNTGPEDDDFVGTWHATKAEYTSVANPTTKVDIITQGSTLVLVLNSAGSFTLTVTDPGQDPETFGGTWSASTDVLTLTWSTGMSGESQFDFTLDGDELTLSGGHMPYEFTPGTPEEATLSLILVRQ